MNLDRISLYLTHKKVIWLILPLCFVLVVIIYANGDKIDGLSKNRIPEIPFAKNDSTKKDNFNDKLNLKDSTNSHNNLSHLDKDGKYIFDKRENKQDTIKSAPLKAEIKNESKPSHASDEVYLPDKFEKERLAELEIIKKEAKQKRLADLLEKLVKQKEAEKQKESDKKPKQLIDLNGISSIDYDSKNPTINTFHGLYSQENRNVADKNNASEFLNFRAVVHSNQEILNGGRVQIRLLEALVIKGKIIPKGVIVYAIASFGTERVKLKISSIFYQETIFPIELEAFDMDGMVGIYVPNILEASALKDASSNSFSAINVPNGSSKSFGDALGNSAINSISNSGKQYLSKKITNQKAVLKSNYFIYLK